MVRGPHQIRGILPQSSKLLRFINIKKYYFFFIQHPIKMSRKVFFDHKIEDISCYLKILKGNKFLKKWPKI